MGVMAHDRWTDRYNTISRKRKYMWVNTTILANGSNINVDLIIVVPRELTLLALLPSQGLRHLSFGLSIRLRKDEI